MSDESDPNVNAEKLRAELGQLIQDAEQATASTKQAIADANEATRKAIQAKLEAEATAHWTPATKVQAISTGVVALGLLVSFGGFWITDYFERTRESARLAQAQQAQDTWQRSWEKDLANRLHCWSRDEPEPRFEIQNSSGYLVQIPVMTIYEDGDAHEATFLHHVGELELLPGFVFDIALADAGLAAPSEGYGVVLVIRWFTQDTHKPRQHECFFVFSDGRWVPQGESDGWEAHPDNLDAPYFVPKSERTWLPTDDSDEFE